VEIKEWTGEEKPLGFYKISEEIYFGRNELSNSDISHLRRSPYDYWYYKNKSTEKEETPSMLLGSLVHSMYLEPEMTALEFVEEIQCDKRTKMGKQTYAAFLEKATGKRIVKPEMWEKAQKMVYSLREHLGSIQELAGPGWAELSGFFELHGVRCRARYDYVAERGMDWDLKTTSDLLAFSKSVANFGYHRQNAFYGMGKKQIEGKYSGFRFVVVENKEPYDCAIFELEDSAIRQGRGEIEDSLDLYTNCVEAKTWPGAYRNDETIYKLELPRWYKG
jgi:hypothetical protein